MQNQANTSTKCPQHRSVSADIWRQLFHTQCDFTSDLARLFLTIVRWEKSQRNTNTPNNPIPQHILPKSSKCLPVFMLWEREVGLCLQVYEALNEQERCHTRAALLCLSERINLCLSLPSPWNLPSPTCSLSVSSADLQLPHSTSKMLPSLVLLLLMLVLLLAKVVQSAKSNFPNDYN